MISILSIDAIYGSGSVSVLRGSKQLFGALGAGSASASSSLPGLIDTALIESSLMPSEIDRIAVSVGPGSHTGLRVGIATALGIAESSGCVIMGIPSHLALAFASSATTTRVIIGIGRGEVGSATVDRNGEFDAGSIAICQPKDLKFGKSEFVVFDEQAAKLTETECEHLTIKDNRNIARLVGAVAYEMYSQEKSYPAHPIYLRGFG